MHLSSLFFCGKQNEVKGLTGLDRRKGKCKPVGGAQQQDKGRQAQARMQEVSSEHEEKLLYFEGGGAL